MYDFVSGQTLAGDVGLYDPEYDNAETYYHSPFTDAHTVSFFHNDTLGNPVYTDSFIITNIIEVRVKNLVDNGGENISTPFIALNQIN